MELILRVHRHLLEKNISYKVLQFSLPTCFTSAVPNIREMIKQRTRWQKGLLSSLRLNLELFFNPRYRSIGMLAIPYYVFFEVISPFMELLGLILSISFLIVPAQAQAMVVIKWTTPFWIWCGGIILSIFNSWISVSIDKFLLRGMSAREYSRLLISLVFSPFFYHFIQLYCKIKGTIEFFSTIQTSTRWDTQRRKI